MYPYLPSTMLDLAESAARIHALGLDRNRESQASRTEKRHASSRAHSDHHHPIRPTRSSEDIGSHARTLRTSALVPAVLGVLEIGARGGDGLT